VLVQVLNKSGREDIAMIAGLAGLTVVALMVLKLVTDLFSQIKVLFSMYG
nr:SpoIIIAC/SpoIIIAD family protein [bacterium]